MASFSLHKQVLACSTCEAVLQSVCEIFVQEKDTTDFMLVKIDLEDALNMISSQFLLQIVRRSVRGAFIWVEWCYGWKKLDSQSSLNLQAQGLFYKVIPMHHYFLILLCCNKRKKNQKQCTIFTN